ncbi:MAG TPA: PAS domain S-box protein [Thermomicrobiales bacterium]|nr:PAS domain S-box protein [Thermomicrobiales bacterium]
MAIVQDVDALTARPYGGAVGPAPRPGASREHADGDATLDPRRLPFHWQRLYASPRVALIVVDTRWEPERIVLWSDAAAAIFGYRAAEVASLDLMAIIPPHLRPGHRDGMRRYRQTREGIHIDGHGLLDLPALTKDGEELTIRMSLGHCEVAGADPARYVVAVVKQVIK